MKRFVRLALTFCLVVPCLLTAQSQKSPAQRGQFLTMFARSYFPGRSGQIMVVPRKGDIITRPEPSYRFMHGSPWDYDVDIPLIFYGPGHVRKGSYTEPANHQDIVPTLAALLRLPLPPTVTGRPLQQALNPAAPPPRLIFLAVLDAVRRDYLDRHASVLPTLTRLRQEGAWFRNARVNYVPTATALAHSTISTGSDPRIHGIVVNSFYNYSEAKGQDTFPGLSPRYLMALTLTDLWGIQTNGQAIMISQGSLPYAAGGLGGHGACLLNGHPLITLAYNRSTGGWDTNSECYTLPDYLKSMNSKSVWESTGGKWMGHDIGNPEAIRRSALFSRFEAEALLAAIQNEPLGADGITDLILVNLKTPDFVGHEYGPDSPEIQDTLAELDRQLTSVLQALDHKIGKNNYVVVMTADHGMPPEPPAGQGRHTPMEIIELINQKFDPGERQLVAYYESSNSQIHLNRRRLAALKVKLSDIARFLESQPFIFAAYTEGEVRESLPAAQPAGRRVSRKD